MQEKKEQMDSKCQRTVNVEVDVGEEDGADVVNYRMAQGDKMKQKMKMGELIKVDNIFLK